ncbi:MAG: protein-export chaperone SecB [Pacificimonas sp.]
MADQQPPAGGPGAEGEQPPIAINILAQYVKDLSFENPGAPNSLRAGQGQPKIDIQIGTRVNPQDQENVYEVIVALNAKAETPDSGQTAFIVELAYGGLFQLTNVPKEHLDLFLLVEAPRMIFPFARRVFADAPRDGGFPPLMLDPVDFLQLAQQQQAAAQQQARGNGDGGLGAPGGDTPNIILPN